jgi:hypothetical protein
MTALEEYRQLLCEVEDAIERLSRIAGVSLRCAKGCARCCQAPTLLPVEAHAILTGADEWRSRSGAVGCPLLSEARLCLAYSVRPMICRVRGLPVLYLDADGKQSREACEIIGFPSDMDSEEAIPLELWNARLYNINVRFCADAGIPLRRISMGDLSRSAGTWLKLAEPATRLYALAASP